MVVRILLAGFLAVVGAGCAARVAAPSGEPVPDPQGFVGSLRSQTLPASPERYTFAWMLDEQGSRVRGRGVVRVEAPERIRLDLFGARGDTYLTAALVEGDYRLPAEAANAVALPSPSLLWAALGVLEPPPTAEISGATTTSASADVRFEMPDGQRFVYTFRTDGEDRYRLLRLERVGRQGVLETVSIDRRSDGQIARARYRDWTAFRDLTLDVEEVLPSDPFPPTIWRPDGGAR